MPDDETWPDDSGDTTSDGTDGGWSDTGDGTGWSDTGDGTTDDTTDTGDGTGWSDTGDGTTDGTTDDTGDEAVEQQQVSPPEDSGEPLASVGAPPDDGDAYVASWDTSWTDSGIA